jgi:SGNH domain (fused to AT3 domains)
VHVRRAGAILLGASLLALLVWLVPFQGASPATPASSSTTSTTTASEVAAARLRRSATLEHIEQLVAASVTVHHLTAQTSHDISIIGYDNADAIDSMPVDCAPATSGCVFGDATSGDVVVLFGDSHARMWLPAITPIATVDHLRLIVVGRNGCPLVAPGLSPRFGGCASVIRRDIRIIDAVKPAAIILADRTTYAGLSAAKWQAGLTATIDGLRPSGARIAVIGDIQVFDPGDVSNLLECLSVHPNAVQDCAVTDPNRAAPGHELEEARATALAHDLYVNPTPWLCTHRACSPIIGNNIVYWDAFHVSVNYAAYLAGVMASALRPFLNAAMKQKATAAG